MRKIMKNNTNQAKMLLEQALRSMPDDFSLSEARNLMRSALASIDKVESRRTSRQAAQDMLSKAMEDRRQVGMPTMGYSMTAQEAKMAVTTLEKMIAREKKMIEDIGSNPTVGGNGRQTPVQTLHS